MPFPVLPQPVAIAVTIGFAALGGASFALLHIPLAWMLGAMTATGVLAWHDRARLPRPLRPSALMLLGLGLGQTFTPTVMAAVGQALGWLVGAAILSILIGVLTARLFTRLAGTDPATGYYCSVPGGVVVMAILAQRAGVSVPAVTLSQTIRVMVVVVLVPPLITWLAPHGNAAAFLAERPDVHLAGLLALLPAGWAAAWLLSRTGISNPWMFGPCFLMIALSALGVLPSGVPMWMVNAAQVGLGSSLGVRISRGFILSSRRLALVSAITTLVLVAAMAAVAVPYAMVSGLPVAAVLLGTSPGGMPEMTITAKVLEVGVPLVLGFHLVRQLFCNLAIAPIWRLMVRLRLV